MQAKGFHVVIVHHIETEVKERLVLSGFRFEKGAEGELELVEHFLVDDTGAVDKVFQQRIPFDGLQVCVGYFYASGS